MGRSVQNCRNQVVSINVYGDRGHSLPPPGRRSDASGAPLGEVGQSACGLRSVILLLLRLGDHPLPVWDGAFSSQGLNVYYYETSSSLSNFTTGEIIWPGSFVTSSMMCNCAESGSRFSKTYCVAGYWPKLRVRDGPDRIGGDDLLTATLTLNTLPSGTCPCGAAGPLCGCFHWSWPDCCTDHSDDDRPATAR
jgi:hypothetical protein